MGLGLLCVHRCGVGEGEVEEEIEMVAGIEMATTEIVIEVPGEIVETTIGTEMEMKKITPTEIAIPGAKLMCTERGSIIDPRYVLGYSPCLRRSDALSLKIGFYF